MEEKLDLRRLNTMTQTDATRAHITPAIARQMLEAGNKRFLDKTQVNRDLLQQVKETSGEKGSQKPYATILHCIDSRASAEIIFDQGIGDIFSIRIAGNIINTDILGSMEFACKLTGTKILMVLGHTSCGAVGGAINGAELGVLTSMLSKIRPAVNAVKQPDAAADRTSKNTKFVNEVSKKNVEMSIQRILNESAVLAKMVADKEIMIIGGMHDITTGKVTFYD